MTSPPLDALIVGSGPTGLTLAAQLRRFNVRFRIVDRLADRGRESRALAVQARTLEIFQVLGFADALVARGRTTTRVTIHPDDRTEIAFQIGDVNAPDTRFPFVLFVSQAETERLLIDHLTHAGVTIERGVELTSAETTNANGVGPGVRCVLRHANGREEQVQATYVLGCDGAHSTVRKLTGIPFDGDAYPQDFVLGDVAIDGALSHDSIQGFARGTGLALLFPLSEPQRWRVSAIAPPELDLTRLDQADLQPATETEAEGALAALQQIVDAATGSAATGRALRLHDPGWVTLFRLHHRQARRYRAGRLFLAGDAAHIHSPVGGQGMNTGIQDAWNLGWKIALVCRGVADDALLDSYETERWPVGRFLLRVTDRAFGAMTKLSTAGPLAMWVRRTFLRQVVARAARSARLRRGAFRFVSELDINYRRSPIVEEGEPRLRGGPKAGDRLPDVALGSSSSLSSSLLQTLTEPTFHLLLCGRTPDAWSAAAIAAAEDWSDNLVTRHTITPQRDPTGALFERLAVRDTAQYLVRPDGHIAYRCAGTDLRGVRDYLGRSFNRLKNAVHGPTRSP